MHVHKLLCIRSLASFKRVEIRNEGLALQMNHALQTDAGNCEFDKIHHHHLNRLPTGYNICTEILQNIDMVQNASFSNKDSEKKSQAHACFVPVGFFVCFFAHCNTCVCVLLACQ